MAVTQYFEDYVTNDGSTVMTGCARCDAIAQDDVCVTVISGDASPTKQQHFQWLTPLDDVMTYYFIPYV